MVGSNTPPAEGNPAGTSEPYQVMPELSTDEFQRLKNDIEQNGIEYPIIVDADGEIIDGHHRMRAWKELGNDPDEIPTRTVDDTSDENYHRAYRSNLLRRDLSDGTKREVVKQYLLEHPDRVAEDTQEAIAEDLGVSRALVTQVANDPDVKDVTPNELTTDEKREQVRTYVENNPDASNREVAREVDCDVTHVTVGNWRDEWEIEEPSTGLDTYTTTKEEKENAQELAQEAKAGNEKAKEQADKVSEGRTQLDKATRKAKKEKNKKQREKKREEQKEKVEQDYFDDDATLPTLEVGDASDLPLENESVDLIITSPPYNLGHGDWKMGGEGREPREDGIGYYDDRDEREYQAWQLNVLQELYRVATKGASLFYNHKPRQAEGEVIHPLDWIRDQDNPWTLRQEVVWDRQSTHNHSPNIFWPVDERVYWLTKGDPDMPDDGTGMESIWRFHGPKPNTDHPAPFPDELPRRCIEALATDEDVILDPFGGSMTTCEVAAKLGYESVGVDINPDWVEKKREQWGVNNE
ncbi:DNA adenine methylase [environmental Halophage eHP-3]|nr:DNA adenine methylase [environmental Halophage eHP-3]